MPRETCKNKLTNHWALLLAVLLARARIQGLFKSLFLRPRTGPLIHITRSRLAGTATLDPPELAETAV